VQLLKYGITAVYEARKLKRPDIRDKEGIRAWLENTLRWIAYLQGMFFKDMQTSAFTLGILLELVKPGEKWEALYAAVCHDFNISTSFPPEKYRPVDALPENREKERQNRLRRLCVCLRRPDKMEKEAGLSGEQAFPDVSLSEQNAAETWLAVIRQLLDHPDSAKQARKTWSQLKS
jgi:hypothetical protein